MSLNESLALHVASSHLWLWSAILSVDYDRRKLGGKLLNCYTVHNNRSNPFDFVSAWHSLDVLYQWLITSQTPIISVYTGPNLPHKKYFTHSLQQNAFISLWHYFMALFPRILGVYYCMYTMATFQGKKVGCFQMYLKHLQSVCNHLAYGIVADFSSLRICLSLGSGGLF